MKFNKILILMLILIPQMVFGSNNWQVVDTIDTPGDGHICTVSPTSTVDIWIMYRRNDTDPMVKFAVRDKYATSFKYIIDRPNTPEKLQEIFVNSRGSLFINGKQARNFIQELKQGNQIRYLIGSSKREYETRAISLAGFTKVYNSINNCKG